MDIRPTAPAHSGGSRPWRRRPWRGSPPASGAPTAVRPRHHRPSPAATAPPAPTPGSNLGLPNPQKPESAETTAPPLPTPGSNLALPNPQKPESTETTTPPPPTPGSNLGLPNPQTPELAAISEVDPRVLVYKAYLKAREELSSLDKQLATRMGDLEMETKAIHEILDKKIGALVDVHLARENLRDVHPIRVENKEQLRLIPEDTRLTMGHLTIAPLSPAANVVVAAADAEDIVAAAAAVKDVVVAPFGEDVGSAGGSGNR